jgi:hypothetical protein
LETGPGDGQVDPVVDGAVEHELRPLDLLGDFPGRGP